MQLQYAFTVIISHIAYSRGFLVLQLSHTTYRIVLFKVILCNKVECILSNNCVFNWAALKVLKNVASGN